MAQKGRLIAGAGPRIAYFHRKRESAVADMQKPGWFDGKINLGNVVSWTVMLVGIAVSYTWIQADVKALQAFRVETLAYIEKAREQRAADRESLLEIKGDIRLIRQILEGAGRKP